MQHRKQAIILLSAGIPFSLVLGYLTFIYPMPKLQSNIFESLVQVISIFSAFVLAIQVYNMSRFDHLKMEYVSVFGGVVKQFLKSLEQNNPNEIVKEVHASPATLTIDKAIEKINHYVAKREKYEPATGIIIKDFEQTHESMRATMIYTLISFGTSLSAYFIGLYYTGNNSGDKAWYYLILSVISLFFTIYLSAYSWRQVSEYIIEHERDLLKNTDSGSKT